MVVLNTARDVVQALGGTSAAAKLANRSPQSITNAQRVNSLPAETFRVMTEALAEKGMTAPKELWRQE
jgi:hypothetical protein